MSIWEYFLSLLMKMSLISSNLFSVLASNLKISLAEVLDFLSRPQPLLNRILTPSILMQEYLELKYFDISPTTLSFLESGQSILSLNYA
ncbi:MAG TPA: hypothetical protein VMW39_06020 [bacterium]|nr:hypothetical protein [bacterium]